MLEQYRAELFFVRSPGDAEFITDLFQEFEPSLLDKRGGREVTVESPSFKFTVRRPKAVETWRRARIALTESEYFVSISSTTGSLSTTTSIHGPGSPNTSARILLDTKRDLTRSEESARAVTEFLARCCNNLDVRSGGSSGLNNVDFGAYLRGASDGSYRLSGEHLTDYCWQFVVPPAIYKQLGSALATVAELVREVEWCTGGPGAVVRVAQSPQNVAPEIWVALRNVVAPLLPPKTKAIRALPDKPIHLIESDWVPSSPEEIRSILLPRPGNY